MDEDEFWTIIETARAASGRSTLGEALGDVLIGLPPERVLDFEERFEALSDVVYRWDVWAAAYLIGGGCSDDSFMDFRAGLLGLGREWFERVAAAPDSLAGHPLVLESGSAAELAELVFSEELSYAAMRAYERLSGVDGSFYDAQAARGTRPSGGAERRAAARGPEMGEDFDFDDEAEMRQRLPRLAALCYDE
jgi:hypothetical protein